MGWPEKGEYKAAVQNPSRCFEDSDLQNGETVRNKRGPKPWPGKNAHVFKIESVSTDEAWAVKCFLNNKEGLDVRYQENDRHLRQSNLPYMIKVEYLSRGILVGGQWYPIVKMPWVEGDRLNDVMRKYADKRKNLELIASRWVELARNLRKAQVAHGDLQHGNVLLVQDQNDSNRYQLTLVDYDGMFVPDLSGNPSGEMGHRCYQHPQRTPNSFNAETDRFSHLVIYCAIHCLKLRGSSLWKHYDNEENLLFREKDLQEPENSDLFRELWAINDPECRALVGRLILAAKGTLNDVPLLDDLVGPGRIPTLTSDETSRIESLLASGKASLPTVISRDSQPPIGEIDLLDDVLDDFDLDDLDVEDLDLDDLDDVSDDELDELDDALPESEEPQTPPARMLRRSSWRDQQPSGVATPEIDHEEQARGSRIPSQTRSAWSGALKSTTTALANRITVGGQVVFDLLRQFKIAVVLLVIATLIWGSWGGISSFAKSRWESLTDQGPQKPLTYKQWRDKGYPGQRPAADDNRSTVLPIGAEPPTVSISKSYLTHSGPGGHLNVELTGSSPNGEPVTFEYRLDPNGLNIGDRWRPATEIPGNVVEPNVSRGLVTVDNVPADRARKLGSEKYSLAFRSRDSDGHVSKVLSRSWSELTNGGLQVLTAEAKPQVPTAVTAAGTAAEAKPQVPTAESKPSENWHFVRTLGGHKGYVTSVAFSPDETTLASGSADITVRLWRVSDGQSIRTLEGHAGEVYSVAFSPDGETLASGSSDKTVRLWRVSDGESLRTLQGHTESVTRVAFSPDGETLASGSADRTVRLWRVSDGESLRTLQGHTESITSVAYGPDGETLASGSADRTVRLSRISDGQSLLTLQGHAGTVSSVAFTPDGETLASGGYDNAVRLWRVSDGQSIRTLEGHASGILSVALSPDGEALASGSADKTVRLWRVSDGQSISTLEGHTEPVTSVAFSVDGKTLASGSGDKTVRLWRAPVSSAASLTTVSTDRASPTEPQGSVPNEPPTVGISKVDPEQPAAGGNLAVDLTGTDSGGEHLILQYRLVSDTVWRTAPQGRVRLTSLKPGPLPLEFRSLNPRRGLSSSVISRTWTVDWTAWRETRTLRGHKKQIYAVAFSPDGNTLATASEDETARLWRVSDGEPLLTLQKDKGKIYSLAFSLDGKVLATGSSDKAVRLCSASENGFQHVWEGSAKPVRTRRRKSDDVGSSGSIEGHSGAVRSVGFGQDDSLLASAGADNTIRLWSTGLRNGYSSSKPGKIITGHTATVYSVAFSSDGKTLASASADMTVRLWRVSDGELLWSRKHDASVWSVDFGTSGTLLASGSSDGTIQICTAETGQILRTLRGHLGIVRKVAFSPDSMILSSAGADKTLRLWRVSDGELLQTLTGHDGSVTSAAFSPDGSTLASADGDGTVRLWGGSRRGGGPVVSK